MSQLKKGQALQAGESKLRFDLDSGFLPDPVAVEGDPGKGRG